MMRASASVIGFLLLVPGRGIAAQAVLAGTIRDDSTGRPLEGADVLIESSTKRGTSLASGGYAISGVPAGNHVALVRLVGYAPIRIAFRASGNDTTWLNARLTRSVQPLEPVTVEAKPDFIAADRLRTFEENRRLGFGKFMDSTYLRKWEAVSFSVLVARVPGVTVVCHRGRRPCYAASNRSGCPMRVFVDGMPSRLTDIGTDWRVSELEAVEIYRSAAELPAEYNSASSACGVLALWTRRP
jgi:hypothetical protein